MMVVDVRHMPPEQWRQGVETRMLVSASNGAAQLCIFEQWIAPGAGAPTHSHPVEEVLTVREGEAEMWMDEQRIIVAVGFLAVAAVVFIAANTTSMTIRERAAEIAILKALGFRRRILLGLLLGETMTLCAAGGLVGAFGSYGLLKLLAHLGATGARPGLGPLSMFEMTETILLQGIALSLVIGAVAGVIPSWGAAKKPVAAAVREVF